MSLDIRALISAHAAEPSALPEADVNLPLAKAPRPATLSVMSDEEIMENAMTGLHRFPVPQRKATA